MTVAQALLLAVVQGISEFLPISSSGHLALLHRWLAIQEPGGSYAVLVHAGTLLATIVFFRKEFTTLFVSAPYQILLKLVVATIPAVVAGLFLSPVLDQLFASPLIVALGFAGSAVVLFLSRFFPPGKKGINDLSNQESFIIGVFQAAALIPGLSRSGTTIFAGQQRGLNFFNSLTFAFLLFVPASLGALTLTLANEGLTLLSPLFIGIGLAVPAVVGYLSLIILQKVMQRNKLYLFSPYCALLAVIVLIV